MSVSQRDRFQHTLDEVLIRLISLEDQMALNKDKLVAEIQENASLVASLVAANTAIVTELRDLAAQGGADQATLDGLADQLEVGANEVLRAALAKTEAAFLAAEIPADEAPAA